ncbi:MAG: methyltransferase domain-containing protein [Xanthomonadales bacterium]|nr:methyltransferase domain-containing protein [Xanthomonadales bacterium]
MHWKLKGRVQKVLGVLPRGAALHYALQRRFGGLGDFAREFDSKVEDWRIMVGHLRDAGVPVAGRHLFEIGSGWYPTFPLALALAGAARVTTVDLNRHLKPDLLRACIERLGSAVDVIAEATGTDAAEVRGRHARLLGTAARTLELDALSDGVIAYHAPADATRSGLAGASVDAMFSNSVLEHVPPDVVDALYAEGMRILVPGGVMFHSVNCGDHYAYVDRRIDQLHYLRYSDDEWAQWNNAFLYQNRLRAHVFVDRARAAGFAIELDTAKASERRLRELAATPVHAQFASIPPERLCITSVDFIARKPPA